MCAATKLRSDWGNYFETKISKTEPHKILIRGYPLEELMGNCTFAEVLWLVLRGELPEERETKMIEALLCCVIDHQFIASVTPAVRFVASSNPQVIPSVVAGILTAGDNQFSPQLTAEFIEVSYGKMTEEGLTTQQAAEAVVADIRNRKRRIPGFGHPTHKEFDPRADRLKELADKEGYGKDERTVLYEAIHREFEKASGRKICMNVDGRMACLMLEMGLSAMQMVAFPVISYIGAMFAHAIEEIEEGQVLRILPDVITEYTGGPERHLPPEKIRV